MKLVKVGDQMINMDLVTHVVRGEQTLDLFFAVAVPQRGGPMRQPVSETASFGIQFKGEEAATLWRWLEQQAEGTA